MAVGMTELEKAEIVELALSGYRCYHCQRVRRREDLVPSICEPGLLICDGRTRGQFEACRDIGQRISRERGRT
jgi:hypothetical protein